ELRRQLARVERTLRCQAPALTGKIAGAYFLEAALEQVAIDKCIAVVERQRQPAVDGDQPMQYRQDRLRFGQPLQYCVTDHQIEAALDMVFDVLPRRLYEGRGLA